MRVSVVVAVLLCQDAAHEQLRECLAVCREYGTPSAERQCHRRCNAEFRADLELCAATQGAP